MSRVRAFFAFLYDFVVGDDWRIAVGVVIAIGVTALISDTSVSAWWVLPAAVAVLLGASVWGVARQRG
jgi:hypothetical protein